MSSSNDFRIDGFEDAVEIGRGGFARVYRARQAAMHRVVAVKVLPGLDDDTVRRFERECRAAGELSDHPHIVSAHDCGVTADGRPFLVMDFFAGGSLAGRLTEAAFAWDEAVEIGIKLAGALETAHRSGVLHRDIKPENVLLSAYGEPALADFGIAVVRGGAETRTGAITASLAHAAPEVLAGERADQSSDVYSLASTVFALISGRAPFARESDETLHPIITRVLTQPVPDLRPAGVPDGICAVLEAAMTKTPAERTRSAEAFGRALQEAQQACGLPPTEMLVRGEVSDCAVFSRPVAAGEPTGVTVHRIRPARPPVEPVAAVSPAKRSRRPLLISAGAVGVAIAVVAAGLALRSPAEPTAFERSSSTDPTAQASSGEPAAGGSAAPAPDGAALGTATDSTAASSDGSQPATAAPTTASSHRPGDGPASTTTNPAASGTRATAPSGSTPGTSVPTEDTNPAPATGGTGSGTATTGTGSQSSSSTATTRPRSTSTTTTTKPKATTNPTSGPTTSTAPSATTTTQSPVQTPPTTANSAPVAGDDRLPTSGTYAVPNTGRLCRTLISTDAGNPRLNDGDPNGDHVTFSIVSREISAGGAGSGLTSFSNNDAGTYVTMESGARLDFCLASSLFAGAYATTPTRFIKIVYRITDSKGAIDDAVLYIWMSNG